MVSVLPAMGWVAWSVGRRDSHSAAAGWIDAPVHERVGFEASPVDPYHLYLLTQTIKQTLGL